jgi:lipoyl synthase
VNAAGRLEEAWRVRTQNFPPTIEFDYPHNTAVVSLTGHSCALKCAHCNGKYLRAMTPITEIETIDVPSALISGGCDKGGKVPFAAHLEKLKRIKSTGCHPRFNWHVGFINEQELDAIAPYVNTISFDFVGDDESIKEVYGLDKTVDDYINAYKMIRARVPVMPHITIGLRGGEISGEYNALRLLREMDADGLVFIVFRPTIGTPFENKKMPAIEDVVNILVEARLMFPDKPVYLGCMRPHGQYRTELDCLAVRAGVNKIVQPADEAAELAKELGLTVTTGEECCAL